jgi:hypothetical protein
MKHVIGLGRIVDRPKTADSRSLALSLLPTEVSMLVGTDEELEYHTARAAQELEQSRLSADEPAKKAHIKLAKLHFNRSQLVAALRKSREERAIKPIHRTDKEG